VPRHRQRPALHLLTQPQPARGLRFPGRSVRSVSQCSDVSPQLRPNQARLEIARIEVDDTVIIGFEAQGSSEAIMAAYRAVIDRATTEGVAVSVYDA
jgi:hypothetical protein